MMIALTQLLTVRFIMMDAMTVFVVMEELLVLNVCVSGRASHHVQNVKMATLSKVIDVSKNKLLVLVFEVLFLIFPFLLNINLMVFVVVVSLLFFQKRAELVDQIYVRISEMDIVIIGMRVTIILLIVAQPLLLTTLFVRVIMMAVIVVPKHPMVRLSVL